MTSRSIRLVLLALALAPWDGVAGSELFRGSRELPVELPVGASISSLAGADLDGDERVDVVLTVAESNEVRVLLNAGDEGVFRPETSYEAGVGPIFVTVGDLDGQLGPDLFVVNSGSSTVSSLLNRGDGSFEAAMHFAVGLQPRVGQLADFNGDGVLDAVTSNLGSFDINVLVGSGGGRFAKDERLAVGDNPHFVVVGDFDGDTRLDVTVAHRDDRLTTGAVSCFKGRGNATFEPASVTDLRVEDVVPRLLAKGDFDGDGALDLAVLNGDRSLLLLRNNGGGEFEVSRISDHAGASAGLFTGFLMPRDFDGDGALDVIAPLARLENHGFRVHRGVGGESAPLDVWLEASVGHLVLADFTGDGADDALVAWAGRPGLALAPGLGPGRVASRGVVPLDEGPRALRIGDVDADRDDDILAMSSNRLEKVVAIGDGCFELATAFELPGRALQDFVAGRFTDSVEDGLEVIATDLAAGELVLVDLRGDEGRELGSIPVAALPSRIASGDIDGDGRIDVAVAHQAGSAATVVLAPGSASPSIETHDVGAEQTAVEIADADGDTDLDIVLATRTGLAVLLGDGEAGLVAAAGGEGLAEFANARGLRIALIAGDERPDLVVAHQRSVTVLVDFLEDGAIRTERRLTHEFGEEVRPLAVADVDGDGRADVLTATSRRLQVLLGGDGGLSAPFPSVVGVSPQAIVTGDFDGDGLTDCASADLGSRAVSVLFGTGVAPSRFRRGDVDGGGGLQINDAIVLLDHLFRGAPAPGCADASDADDSGSVNLTDAIRILDYLFRGGIAPPSPGPEICGSDPTGDGLDCATPCP